MQLKKDALLFYGGIKALMPDAHGKCVVDIILGERAHVSDIHARQKKLR